MVPSLWHSPTVMLFRREDAAIFQATEEQKEDKMETEEKAEEKVEE